MMHSNVDFYLPKKWPSWKEDISTLYSNGCTNIEVQAEIQKRCKSNFNHMTFNNWRTKVDVFKEVIDAGQLAKKAWWFQQGRLNISNNKFNTSLYTRMMGNLFAFKSEVALEGEAVSSVAKVDMSKWSTEDIEAYVKLIKKAKEKEQAAKERADTNVVTGRFGTGTDD